MFAVSFLFMIFFLFFIFIIFLIDKMRKLIHNVEGMCVCPQVSSAGVLF
jgi:hypothetical protein